MIPFAAKIINTLNQNKYFEVYSIVVNSDKKSYKKFFDGIDNKHIIQIEYPRKKLIKFIYKFYPFSIIRAIKYIEKQHKPDIIHLLTGDFSLAPYFLIHKKNNKWFYTVHDLYAHEVKSTNLCNLLLHKYIVWGYKLLRDRINNLTTSSKFQLKELKNIYPNKHITFTHFPSLVTSQIQYGGKNVKELSNIKDYILFFGSVDEYKGVDLLIKAYIKSKKLNHYKLIIAGRGLSYNEIINNNKDIIRINRFIDDSEIKDLFQKALYVVYPYKSATMSGVLSIAYYFKKRVILSSIPFFIENASSYSNFFQTGNITSLQEQMEHMVTQNIYNSNDINCYENIYSDKILIADYIKLYSQR